MGSRFTAARKAELAAEYLMVQHGLKGQWCVARGVTSSQIARWKRAYMFGDLELGLEPRDTSGMDSTDGAEFQRLQAQLQTERALRAREQREHEAEVDRLHQINDSLGKAIGLLHAINAKQEPDDPQP